MANTVWNGSDKTAGVALTGSNLIATATAGGGQAVRAVDKQVVGKFYWECTCNTIVSAGTGPGFASSIVNLAATPTVTSGICYLARTGLLYVDGASSGVAFGTVTAGTVVCIAYDCTNRLAWFRLGAAGNWNTSASANPATGVGGVTTLSLGAAIPVFPTAWFNTTSDQITANFGDTAFVGAVPSGYTSGFPTSADTVLLVHADGTNGSTSFTDVSRYAHILSPVGAFISTTSPKFGTGSADFTTAGSRIPTGSNLPEWNFGAGQFTVEAWAYFTVAPTGVQAVLAQFGGASNLGWFFGMNAGSLSFFYSTTGTDNPVVAGTYAPTLNTWIHLAADRNTSNVLRVYANGAVIASATVSATIFASTLNVIIGNDLNNTRNFPGRLDEIRITKGAAIYGGAFTPPTAPFDIGTNALASQALAEHWLTTNPQAQVTQVVAEHWASVASGNLQAVVTQVMLEHWASVAVVVPAAGGPMVTMIH